MKYNIKNKISEIIKAMFFETASQKKILGYNLLYHIMYCFSLLFFFPLIVHFILTIVTSRNIYFLGAISSRIDEILGIIVIMVVSIILFIIVKKKFEVQVTNQVIFKVVLFANSIRAFTEIFDYIFNGFLLSLAYYVYSIMLIRFFFMIDAENKQKITWYVVIVYGCILFFLDFIKYPLAFLLLKL